MRRRLLDVGKKVSGVLAGPRDEALDGPAQDAEPPAGTPAGPSAGTPAPPPTEEPPAVPVTADSPTLDEACAAAVEVARAAAVEAGGRTVGDHLGAEPEPTDDGAGLVTHSFASTDPAYTGWRWAVTVARAAGRDEVTVDEVVLLPGGEALLAPAWVPWSERVQPGDLSPGDLLPPPPDDVRLVPAYADVDAPRLPFDLHREMGLGRPRVLSREGRSDAAERWLDGPTGPGSPMAKAAPAHCRSCGFLAPLAGALGTAFGACTNAMAPDDGRVVALEHGCGAHSEVVVETPASSYAGMAVVDDEFEVVEVERDDEQDEPAVASADVPEDATLPGVDEPPLDDVVAAVES